MWTDPCKNPRLGGRSSVLYFCLAETPQRSPGNERDQQKVRDLLQDVVLCLGYTLALLCNLGVVVAVSGSQSMKRTFEITRRGPPFAETD